MPTAEPFVRLITLATRDRIAVGERSRTMGATYEERTGQLIKRASNPAGLDDKALYRVWLRLGDDASHRRRALIGAPFRWALVAAVLTVSGAVVGAEVGVWTWPRVMVLKLTGQSAEVSRPSTAGRRQVSAGKIMVGRSTEPPALSPPPASEPIPATPLRRTSHPASPRGRMRIDLATAPAPAVAESSANSTLAEESLVLGRALAGLRQGHDPAQALVELDRYAARFPSGILGPEAQSARVDAFLMMGRLAEARTVLSGLRLGSGARELELRLIRAELTAENTCAAALGDYEFVLAESPSAPLAERALWGRAACHTQLRNEAQARVDLADYIVRFPNGPHADAARARLRN